MAEDPNTRPVLTDEEIMILKGMVRGRKAIMWLGSNMKSIAVWIAAIIGAFTLLEEHAARLMAKIALWWTGGGPS